uniref:S-protein homolog n=1 Tax=Solanum tuberosum TaxID=4113 RepID=M1DPD1_SOLTU
MTRYTNFPLILILVVSLTLSQFSFYSIADSPTPKVHFIDDLPNLNPVVKINCVVGGGTTMVHKYEEYSFDAGITTRLYACYAIWNDSTTRITAYDPFKVDKGQPIVHWSIRDTGFWKSFDNRNWNFYEKWFPN